MVDIIMHVCSLKGSYSFLCGPIYFLKLCITNLNQLWKKFSLKLMKVNGEVPLGLHQNLDLALVQGIITDRQISASLSCQWSDFYHPSLPHSISGRGLKIIQESWLFLNSGELQENAEMTCGFRCGAKYTTWTYGDILNCPLLFFFS